MSESTTIFQTPEAVEKAFYTAFVECDLQAMANIWANDDVICIHPGSSVLIGHAAVIRSWQNILANAEPPHLHFEVLNRYLSSDLALHIVEEQIRSETSQAEAVAIVLATNVYRRDERGWRMIQHHASVTGNGRRRHRLQ